MQADVARAARDQAGGELSSARHIRAKALQWLARREYGRGELGDRLQTRGYPRDLVTEVVAELERQGMVDDRRFAGALAHSHSARGLGPVRIAHDLEQRGVSRDLCRQALEQEARDWVALARGVYTKRFGVAAPRTAPERQRRMRFLLYRGFTSDQARAALDTLSQDDPSPNPEQRES